MQLTPDELRNNEEELRCSIQILWQTRILRSARLSVYDEINNGLAYYHYTFLTEVPRLYAEMEDLLERRMGAVRPYSAVSSYRQLDRRRSRRQSFRHP